MSSAAVEESFLSDTSTENVVDIDLLNEEELLRTPPGEKLYSLGDVETPPTLQGSEINSTTNGLEIARDPVPLSVAEEVDSTTQDVADPKTAQESVIEKAENEVILEENMFEPISVKVFSMSKSEEDFKNCQISQKIPNNLVLEFNQKETEKNGESYKCVKSLLNTKSPEMNSFEKLTSISDVSIIPINPERKTDLDIKDQKWSIIKRKEMRPKKAVPMLVPKPTPPPVQPELLHPLRILRVPQYGEEKKPSSSLRPTALVNPFPAQTDVKPQETQPETSDRILNGSSNWTPKETLKDKKQNFGVESGHAKNIPTIHDFSKQISSKAPQVGSKRPKKGLHTVIEQLGARSKEALCASQPEFFTNTCDTGGIVTVQEKPQITDPDVIDRLKRLGTVIELEEEPPLLIEKETNSLALLEKMTINKPQSPVVSALDDRPVFSNKDISVFTKTSIPVKKPATIPEPVLQVTCTSVPTMSPPEPCLLEPLIDIVEDVTLSYEGKFIFKMDSFHVDLPNETKVFSCDICSAVYHHSHMLKKHYLRLHIARKYIPEREMEVYNIQPEAYDEKEGERMIYRCHTCRQCLPTRNDLKSHLMDHPPITELNKQTKGLKNYKCDICNTTFKWRKVYARHRKICKSPKTIESEVLNEKVEETKEPEEVIKTIEAEEVIKTKEPQENKKTKMEDKKVEKPEIKKVEKEVKKITKKEVKKTDKKLDPIKIRAVYNFSDEASNNPSVIEEEEIQDKGKSPSPNINDVNSTNLHHCLYCNETFMTPNIKRNHVLSAHPHLRKSHICQFCKKEFTSKQNIFTHLLQDHPMKYFGCMTCKERFLNLPELKKHVRKKHNLEKDELALLSRRTSSLAQEKDHFLCETCNRMFLIESCFKNHKCLPEKPLKQPKIRKSKSFEKPEKVETRVVDPETMFYSQVSLNVRDNLLHHLDGKLDSSEVENEPERPSRTFLNFSDGFPTPSGLLKSEPEIVRPKTPWEKYNFPKSYDGKSGLTSYIKDMSYLDISTQLIMRKNLQNLESSPSKSETGEDVPSVLALERLGAKCAESYSLKMEENESRGLGELSGEWVRDRTYICSVCKWQTPCLWSMEDHKYEVHPGVHCPQHELVGEQKSLSSIIYSRLVPVEPLFKGMTLPTPPPLSEVKCTKCNVGGFTSRGDLHVHILQCAGVEIQPWLPTPKKKRWRRKRRARRGMKRNIPSTPHRIIKLRTKPGDTDTIQKMIANLPAKRSTRRVIGFDEADLKTRSQSTIQNVPQVVQKAIQKKKMVTKGKEEKKEIQIPLRETDLIDTSAERGDVLSSLRMMPVSTPREELLEPRQILDKVLGVRREEIPSLPCSGCGQTYDSKTLLKKHHKTCVYFRESGSVVEHKCKTCLKTFDHLVALIEHSCNEMPKLEIEKDLSPCNSEIPVLSPETKKPENGDLICGISFVDGLIKYETLSSISQETGNLSDDSNASRKRKSSLESLQPRKKRRKRKFEYDGPGPVRRSQIDKSLIEPEDSSKKRKRSKESDDEEAKPELKVETPIEETPQIETTQEVEEVEEKEIKKEKDENQNEPVVRKRRKPRMLFTRKKKTKAEPVENQKKRGRPVGWKRQKNVEPERRSARNKTIEEPPPVIPPVNIEDEIVPFEEEPKPKASSPKPVVKRKPRKREESPDKTTMVVEVEVHPEPTRRPTVDEKPEETHEEPSVEKKKKKKKKLIKMKILKKKKKKKLRAPIVKEVVKVAGFSWEVSEVTNSPPKVEPSRQWVEEWPNPPAEMPQLEPVASPAPLPPPPTAPSSSSSPASTPAPSSTPVLPLPIEPTTPSLGTIIDSVNKLLNEPESTYMPFGLAQYSLADLQKAMGASDDEMAVLQQLGEASCLQDELADKNVSYPPKDESYEADIIDLDNQPQQPIVSSSVSESTPELKEDTNAILGPSSFYKPRNFLKDDNTKSTLCRFPSSRLSSSTSLLAPYNGKEVVCPSCSSHFMGFQALQKHVNTVHSTQDTQGGKKMAGTNKLDLTASLTRRVELNSMGSRLVCFECHQILPTNLMSTHLENDHKLDASDVSKCSTVSGETNNGPVVGERLKSKMSSALGDLLDKAVNNLLSAKTKTEPLSGGAVEFLTKLCNMRKREGSGKHSNRELFTRLKLGEKFDGGDDQGAKASVSRPYSCTICGQKFALAASRNKHEVLAHRSYKHEDHSAFYEDFDDYDDWRQTPSPSGSACEETERDFNPTCSDCGLSFSTLNEMLKHRVEDHAQRRNSAEAAVPITAPSQTVDVKSPDPKPQETPISSPEAPMKPAKKKRTRSRSATKSPAGPAVRARAEAALRQLSVAARKKLPLLQTFRDINQS